MLWTIFWRTLILYSVLLLVIRIMGKREIAQLSPIDLVVAVMMADAAIIVIEDTNIPLTAGLIPIATLAGAEILLSYLSLKNQWVRKLVCGVPSVIIEKGRINIEEMARNRYNLNDLMEQLRLNDIHHIDDVEYAVLEASGQLSVVPKNRGGEIRAGGGEAADPGAADTEDGDPDAGDPEAGFATPGLAANLVLDGRVDDRALHRMGMDRRDLLRRLRQKGIDDLSDVFLATIDEEGRFYLQTRDNS